METGRMDRYGEWLPLLAIRPIKTIFLVCCTAFLGTNAALAQPGGSAIWWDPERSGTGVAVDIQDQRAALVEFAYRPNGVPVWYLTSLLLESTEVMRFVPSTLSEASGVRILFGGGQCIGCPHSVQQVQKELGELGLSYRGYGRLSFTPGYGDRHSNQLEPMLFGYRSFGRGSPSNDSDYPDFRGRWIFVEEKPEDGGLVQAELIEIATRPGASEIPSSVDFIGQEGFELNCQGEEQIFGGPGNCIFETAEGKRIVALKTRVGIDRIFFDAHFGEFFPAPLDPPWHGIRIADRPVSDGLWWNREAPGTGLLIEEQNGVVFVVYFVYRPNGAAVWYTASGELGDDGVFEGRLQQFADGQCLECDYTAPELVREGRRISIDFHGLRVATLDLGGVEPVMIERMNFGYQEFGIPELAPKGVFPDLRGLWVFANLDDPSAEPIRVELESVQENQANSSGDKEILFEGPNASVLCQVQDGPIKTFTTPTCQLRVGGDEHLLALSEDVNFDVIRGRHDSGRWAGFRIK